MEWHGGGLKVVAGISQVIIHFALWILGILHLPKSQRGSLSFGILKIVYGYGWLVATFWIFWIKSRGSPWLLLVQELDLGAVVLG